MLNSIFQTYVSTKPFERSHPADIERSQCPLKLSRPSGWVGPEHLGPGHEAGSTQERRMDTDYSRDNDGNDKWVLERWVELGGEAHAFNPPHLGGRGKWVSNAGNIG